MTSNKKSPKSGIIKKKSKRVAKSAANIKLEKKKEESVRILAKLITEAGYQVRREKLKRGPNWSAQSGICNVHEDVTVFVDRTSSLEDQLDFLVASLPELGVEVKDEDLLLLPDAVQKMIVSTSLPAVA